MATKVISVLNHKGGVGKTTTVLNLAAGLSFAGKRVLMVDLDPQSNLTQGAGKEFPEVSVYNSLKEGKPLPIEEVNENLYIVPSDLELAKGEEFLRQDLNGFFKLKKLLDKVKDDFDFVLIDCPPSLGILPTNALIASNYAIIVVQAQYFSVKGLQTVFEFIEDLKENLNPDMSILGMLLTQVTHNVITRTIIDTVREGYGQRVFESYIRQNVAVQESSYNHQDIFTYSPKSYGAEDYHQLAGEILSMFE